MMILLAAVLSTTAPLPSHSCTVGASLIRLYGVPVAVTRMGTGGLELIAEYAREEPGCLYAAMLFGASGSKETAFLLKAASDALDVDPDTILRAISDGVVTAPQVCRFGGLPPDANRTPAGMKLALQAQRKAVDTIADPSLQPSRQQCVASIDAELKKLAEKPKAPK